jgi:sulfur-oxidizing protein SoxZ
MAGSHKLRAKLDGEGALVKMLLRHPMETGARKDPGSGETIPRHFIQEVRCEHNDAPVLTSNWGWGIAKNPFLSFRLRKAKAGDRIRVLWTDNLGKEDSVETQVK